MKKPLIIGLVIVVACGALYWCTGEDESEPKITVRRLKMSEEDETGTLAPLGPGDRKSETTQPGLLQPEGEPGTSESSPHPSQVPPQSPQSPLQSPPQSPKGPGNLEEATPEEEEKAKKITLEDERVQGLISGSNYKLKVIGSMISPDGGNRCLLLLELENGEEYTIIVDMDEGAVEEIREGQGPQPGGQGSEGGG